MSRRQYPASNKTPEFESVIQAKVRLKQNSACKTECKDCKLEYHLTWGGKRDGGWGCPPANLPWDNRINKRSALFWRPASIVFNLFSLCQCAFCEKSKECIPFNVVSGTVKKACEGQEWKYKQCVGEASISYKFCCKRVIEQFSTVCLKIVHVLFGFA